MWQLLWDVCFLVLGASRSLNVESSLKYCQQSGKINTNRQPHLVISHQGFFVAFHNCYNVVHQPGQGRGGAGAAQCSQTWLNWVYDVKTSSECFYWYETNLSGDTKVGPSGESRIFDTTAPILHLKEFVKPDLHNSRFLSSSTTPPFIAQVQTTYIIKHLNPER